MQGKIIGVGFQKTGTSTLREALKILGYRVKDVTPRALIPILRGKYDRILRIIRKYDAVEDTPWYMIYRELDQLLPGSKFILTIRDEQSWFKSVANHVGDLRAAQHEWIYGRGKGIPGYSPENAIQVFNRHNKGVIEYFTNRPDDLLILDFTSGDGWDKLCRFLDKPVPEVPFPHYNRTIDAETKKSALIYRVRIFRHRVKNQFKILVISLMGWWPE